VAVIDAHTFQPFATTTRVEPNPPQPPGIPATHIESERGFDGDPVVTPTDYEIISVTDQLEGQNFTENALRLQTGPDAGGPDGRYFFAHRMDGVSDPADQPGSFPFLPDPGGGYTPVGPGGPDVGEWRYLRMWIRPTGCVDSFPSEHISICYRAQFRYFDGGFPDYGTVSDEVAIVDFSFSDILSCFASPAQNKSVIYPDAWRTSSWVWPPTGAPWSRALANDEWHCVELGFRYTSAQLVPFGDDYHWAIQGEAVWNVDGEQIWQSTAITLGFESDPHVIRINDVFHPDWLTWKLEGVDNTGTGALDIRRIEWADTSNPCPTGAILPQPPNCVADNYADACEITGECGQIFGNTAYGTREAGETGGNFVLERSIWYRWTAVRDARIIFRTRGSAVDTEIGVYRGATLGTATQVAYATADPWEPDGSPTNGAAVEVSVIRGQEFHIRVATSTVGQTDLQWGPARAELQDEGGVTSPVGDRPTLTRVSAAGTALGVAIREAQQATGANGAGTEPTFLGVKFG
jgi:hypothetical protein